MSNLQRIAKISRLRQSHEWSKWAGQVVVDQTGVFRIRFCPMFSAVSSELRFSVQLLPQEDLPSSSFQAALFLGPKDSECVVRIYDIPPILDQEYKDLCTEFFTQFAKANLTVDSLNIHFSENQVSATVFNPEPHGSSESTPIPVDLRYPARQETTELLTAGPLIGEREMVYTADACSDGWNSNSSKYLELLVSEVRSFLSVDYVIPTSSCTGALHLALLAAGVGPGDEVIVPETTWIASASAVAYTGAKPILCDVDRDTWTIDTKLIDDLITPKTVAIIPVHLYGYLSDMSSIKKIAEKHGLLVIEDAAAAYGATFENKKAGTLGDAGCFSFQGAKTLVSGEGGLLVTNSSELYERALKLNDHGRRPGTFFIDEVGFKYKMSNLTAAIALGQVQNVSLHIDRKLAISQTYQRRLEKVTGLSTQSQLLGSCAVRWMNSVAMDPNLGKTAEQLRNHLKGKGIDSRPIFPPVSRFELFGTDSRESAVANWLADFAINIPSGSGLAASDAERVCDEIMAFVT